MKNLDFRPLSNLTSATLSLTFSSVLVTSEAVLKIRRDRFPKIFLWRAQKEWVRGWGEQKYAEIVDIPLEVELGGHEVPKSENFRKS